MTPGSSTDGADVGLLPALTVIASLLLAFWVVRCSQKQRSGRTTAATESENDGEDSWRESYRDPLLWAFLPEGGPCLANQEHAETFESDLCTLKVLPLHRPTHEPWREATGQYPFSWHMAGRRRLWEIRVQLRLKQVPKTKVYFGITLGDYVPVSGFSQQVQRALVRACRSVVGDLYHSPGDNPAHTDGEVEPPTFVMPLWAFDQFIISDPGDEPHLWGNLEGLGMRRTDGLAAYVKAIKNTIDTFSTDKVYTFSFWGVSQFLDCINWEICGGFIPGVRSDFNKLCGSAPVYVAMYEMPGVSEQSKHLPSRKKYYFHIAMWSQLRPPKPDALDRLFGRRALAEASPTDTPRSPSSGERFGFLACCTARGSGLGQEAKDPKALESVDEGCLGG